MVSVTVRSDASIDSRAAALCWSSVWASSAVCMPMVSPIELVWVESVSASA
ncbi:hypothetical protein D3C87_1931350 [compost metagenome]